MGEDVAGNDKAARLAIGRPLDRSDATTDEGLSGARPEG